MSLTTPVQGELEVNPDSVGGEGSDGAMHVAVYVCLVAVPGPGTGARQTPPSSCDLLQPGLL
jgi:hypothetical protein